MAEAVGGQAVIEGVMMRKRDKIATAVRLSNGKIKIKKEKLKERSKFWKILFIRGIVSMYDMLVIGIKTLLWSADQQLEKDEKISSFEVAYTLVISVAFAILFFIAIPFFLAKLFVSKGIWFNLIDGLIRMIVFLVYFIIISLFKDVKRIFEYHGAEHSVVNAYEAGKKLTVENVKKFTTLNPRCGTSFILIVLIVSIIVFSIISSDFWYINLVIRIIFIPVIASISYEILKLSAKYHDNFLMKLIAMPGLLLQKISTQKPDKKQIEVAIAALKAVL